MKELDAKLQNQAVSLVENDGDIGAQFGLDEEGTVVENAEQLLAERDEIMAGAKEYRIRMQTTVEAMRKEKRKGKRKREKKSKQVFHCRTVCSTPV